MSKTIAVHSYKGGTGKTLISANLAAIYAKEGFNVCLLDYDFRAPSLQVLFKRFPARWLNDFLEEKCEVEEALVELNYDTKGKFLVGFSNPTSKAMREMMAKDRVSEMEALHRTLTAKREVYEMGIDYLIFDTSPGIHYSSINALAASDAIVLVMKNDAFDLEGTKELIQGIYDVLGRKTGIILNKVLSSEETSKKMQAAEKKKLAEKLEADFERPILSVIPCYCDVLLSGSQLIHAIHKPEHPLIESLSMAAKKLEKL